MAKLCAPGPDPYTYTGHTGIDFLRGPKYLGKPFYASGPGRVVRLSKNAAGGCWIVVRYDGTANDVGYAHMYNHNGCPRPGTRFNTGAQLGFVGALGTRVTGAHIHVEVLGRATPAAVWGIFTPSCYATGASAPTGTPKPTPVPKPVDPEEEDIDMSQIRYVHRVEPGYGTEWMIVGMEVPGGYQTTTDQTTAEGWGAVYGTDKGDSWKALNRKQYIALQSSAAELNRKWTAKWIEMLKSIRS